MLVPVLLCFFAAVANYGIYGWKTGYIYKYDYKSCFQIRERGIVAKSFITGDIYIQPLSSDELSVTFQNCRKQRKKDMKEMDHCVPFPSDELNFTRESVNFNPFEINFKRGILTSLRAIRNLRDGDSNFVMVLAEQFQLCLRGENCEEPKSCHSSPEIKPNAVYQVTENTIGGKCETRYEVFPLPEDNFHRPDENRPVYKVVKTVDYKKCQEHLKDPEYKEPDLFTHTNSVIASGNEEEHIIQAINSTIQRAEFLGPKHLSKPTHLLVTNMTLISTNPTDGHPQNVSNPRVYDVIYLFLG